MKNQLPQSRIGLVIPKFSVTAIILLLVLNTQLLLSQNVSINTDGSPPDSSAILDISADNKGILIPRVSLSGTDDTTTIISPQISLFVYNTATTVTVTPGYYHWDGNAWSRLSTMWKQDSLDIYYNEGNVGIGTQTPTHLLEVIGNPGVDFTPTAYFENTCDTVDGQPVDGIGVMGVSDITDRHGFGVYGRGGLVGVRGRVFAADTFTYYGVAGAVTGGSGTNLGVLGTATGDGNNIGVDGTSHGPDHNIGVQGFAWGGHTNYAIYGNAQDTSATSQTYAGFFDGDVHISDRLGIGVQWPILHKLSVIGESGVSHQPIAYFENLTDTVDGQSVDAYGVMGVCDQTDWAGYGGKFRGGFIGALGEVFPTDTFSYFGVRGLASGGSGTNFGTHGYAEGDGTSVGVRGRANGTDVNYGLWGYATGGLTNYAVHGTVDTTGVPGTYAGYFEGDTYISGDVGIGTESPDHTFELATDQRVATIYLTTHRNTGFSAGQFMGRSARGTQDAPSNSMAGDWLASFGGKGYSDSGFTGVGPSARMSVQAAENWSDTTKGTHILFYTTPVGQAGMSQRLKINENGFIGIGTSNPDQLLTLSGNSSRIRSYTIDDFEESSLEFMRARAGETAVTEGELLGKIEGIGYEGADYQAGAGIRFYAEGGVGSGSIPGRIDLLTSPGSGSDVLPRLTVRHSGRVGIGTTDPQSLMHLFSSDPGGLLRIQSSNSDPAERGMIEWFTSQNTDTWAAKIGPSTHPEDQGLVIGTNSLGDFNNQKDIVFKTSDNERMRIRANGKVGIGITNPGAMLEVDGETWLNAETVIDDNLVLGRASTDNHILIRGTAGNSILKMFSTGEFLMASDSGVTTLIASGGDFKIQTLDGSHQDRLFVKKTGDVGIGTITPNFKLDIAGDLNYTGSLRKNGMPVSFSGDFSDGGESASMHRSLGNTDNFHLGLMTDGMERILIQGDGKVGIGTTSPNELLEVKGGSPGEFFGLSINQNATGSGYPSLFFRDENDNNLASIFPHQNRTHLYFRLTTGDFVFDRSPSQNVHMIIKENGNVGIGNSTPGHKLDISGDMNYTGTLRQNGTPVSFTGDFSEGGESAGADRTIGNINNYALGIKTNNTTRLHITNNGNIGIGTTSPFGDLQIADDDGDPTFSILRNISGSEVVSLFSQEGSGLFLYVNSGTTVSAPAKLFISTTGNVGVGTTSPNARLQVNGGVQIADDPDLPSAIKVGTLRYRADSNNSYVEMCMQTGSATYEWVIVKQNTW